MNAHFNVENPEKIIFTLQITMKLEDWMALSKQLSNQHPSWQIADQITSMVSQAQKTFWPQDETKSS